VAVEKNIKNVIGLIDIDKKKIYNKALNMGLILENQALTDREIYNLIFHPGLSTAENVTKFSGRGVGMDVVKKGIEALRGTVEIDSEKGFGTTVRIRLPLTLAIIDGFMFTVEDAKFIIPLEMVIECLELSGKIKEASDKRNYINLRGEVLPYVRLRDVFGLLGNNPEIEYVVIVKYGQEKLGIVVDSLKGEVQTVIKNLGVFYKNIKHISGATILGDGNVALILDIQHLLSDCKQGGFTYV
jgi:two-component system chemotaxis sensor kinase CheA